MVSSSRYVPDRGDVVWIDFNPQTGHEQAGRRPAVVLSPALYNGRTGLALLCPVTNQIKGYPFEVTIPQGLNVTGVVLADQVKSLDWQRRNATLTARMPQETIDDILDRLDILLGRGST